MSTYYIDNAATGSNDGTSWVNAWTDLNSASAAQPGDIVYVSGGTVSKTYNMSGVYSLWQIASGVHGNPITYKIGQESGHNGNAIFNNTSAGDQQWITNRHDVIISGDAGDGGKHFRITGFGSVFEGGATNCSGVRLSYIYADDCDGAYGIMSFNSADTTGIEVDNCFGKVTRTETDKGFEGRFTGTGYDQSWIHDNEFWVPQDPLREGYGPDCAQLNGSGWSFYDNILVSYLTAFIGTEGQHCDGIQTLGNNGYFKIYGNRFVDFTSYPIYLEAFSGGFSHVRIYNNTLVTTITNTTQGVVVSGTTGKACTDVAVCNNNTDGIKYGIAFRDPSGDNPDAFVDCFCYNNALIDDGGNPFIDPNIASEDNVRISAVDAVHYFSSYTEGSDDNDYHLASGATVLIGNGTDASAFFDTDAGGITRTIPWDIGAYKYETTGPLAPSLLSATAISTSVIGLAWTNNAVDATSIKIERSSDNATFVEIDSIDPAETTYDATGLAIATQFWFRVRAHNDNGYSAYSNTATATTSTLSVPTLSSGQCVGSSEVGFLFF